ncbi:9025_t:CDS:1, partial [Cetraspora pellucida]
MEEITVIPGEQRLNFLDLETSLPGIINQYNTILNKKNEITR